MAVAWLTNSGELLPIESGLLEGLYVPAFVALACCAAEAVGVKNVFATDIRPQRRRMYNLFIYHWLKEFKFKSYLPLAGKIDSKITSFKLFVQQYEKKIQTFHECLENVANIITSFKPHFINKTTSVARMNMNINQPHYLFKPMKMRQ